MRPAAASLPGLRSVLGRLSFPGGARCRPPCMASTSCGRAPKLRCASTAGSAAASSSRWKQRQGKDFFAREAKVQGLKSRAAFKLLEIDAKYRIFKRGQSVVDLGYAPGSWSQVAAERTKPTGRILGIDLIPAQPPRGVSTIQGDFLSPHVRRLVRQFLADDEVRHRRQQQQQPAVPSPSTTPPAADDESAAPPAAAALAEDHVAERPSYIDIERHAVQEEREAEAAAAGSPSSSSSAGDGLDAEGTSSSRRHDREGRLVDVVLSDMSAPWPQTTGFSANTLTNPYTRMMNTSGMPFRDHAGSMDLCTAALSFANDTLRGGGHFVCKFYQGGEDKTLERRLRKLFAKVYREKPESSRNESKETFFVALRRKEDVVLQAEDLEPPP